MNPDASNYNSNATVDDGSCVEDIPDGFTFVERNAQGYNEYTHDASGIEFVLLPGGEFEMGSPDTEAERSSDESPVHTVKLRAFLIAKYEVTQAEYAAVMENPPDGLSATPSRYEGDNRPVEQVSSVDLKRPDGFLAQTGLSLPSEAQWEYACRAGTTGAFAGTGILDDMGWYSDNIDYETHDVGGKLPNDFGLHDMHGNVFEWCEDVYDPSFYDSEFAYGPDPVATSGSGARVIRGGDFNDDALLARSANRLHNYPTLRINFFGFRPARPLP